jgi:two-component system sensor histidine kinase KdpD
VDKVLQMTRMEMGAIVLERDWAAVPEIIGSVLSRLRERLAAHRLVVDVPPDLPLVHVDAALIEQVLANLLENAARHTPAGTLVHVRVLPSPTEQVVSVEDLGPGLDDRDIERVFDKFYRHAVEGPVSGAGLGLAICKAIVSLHGGRIWAEQIPGGGTAFRFALKVEPVPQMPDEAEAG